MSNIILLGFFGAGKSSVGSMLAKRLSYSFVELENEVKKKTGLGSITEAYEKDLLKWREGEIAACRAFSTKEKLVIAGTSGFVENSINILYFRKNSPGHKIIYLKTSLDVIRSRLQLTPERGSRPVDRVVDKIAQHFTRRDILYSYYSNEIVDTTSRSSEETVNVILKNVLK